MSDKSILEYNISPFVQAGGLLAAITVFILLGKAIGATGLVDIDEGTPWLVACSFTLLFAIFNSVLSLSTPDQNKYWLQSIMSYIILVVGGGGIAYFFSGHGMDDVGSYRWIYIVFTIGYILLLTIMRTMRRIVKLAQEQDKRLRGED